MLLVDAGPTRILRYQVSIPMDNLTLLEHATDWASALELDCIIRQGVAYFSSYDDALLFILKWQ